MKILITGFEPFGKRQANYSWEIAKAFKERGNINVMELPVSFLRAHEIVIDKISNEHYNLILMLGETSSSLDHIRLERVALNLKDSVSPDNDGEYADESTLKMDGPNAFFTNLPIKKIGRNLSKQGYNVKVSNSAGTFVCNCLYYNILHHLNNNPSSTEAIFIHLPSSEEHISKREMIKTVDAILNECYLSYGN